MAVNRRLRDAWRFFHGRTGCVGREAQAALDLARAEVAAGEDGFEFRWEYDPDGMPEDGLCSCGCGHEIQTCESCVCVDADGNALGSLYGIWDADDDYRRHVEAELACEALWDLLECEASKVPQL